MYTIKVQAGVAGWDGPLGKPEFYGRFDAKEEAEAELVAQHYTRCGDTRAEWDLMRVGGGGGMGFRDWSDPYLASVVPVTSTMDIKPVSDMPGRKDYKPRKATSFGFS